MKNYISELICNGRQLVRIDIFIEKRVGERERLVELVLYVLSEHAHTHMCICKLN